MFAHESSFNSKDIPDQSPHNDFQSDFNFTKPLINHNLSHPLDLVDLIKQQQSLRYGRPPPVYIDNIDKFIRSIIRFDPILKIWQFVCVPICQSSMFACVPDFAVVFWLSHFIRYLLISGWHSFLTSYHLTTCLECFERENDGKMRQIQANTLRIYCVQNSITILSSIIFPVWEVLFWKSLFFSSFFTFFVVRPFFKSRGTNKRIVV